MFEAYCRMGCTEQEICEMFGGIEHDDLEAWCQKEYEMHFEQVYKMKLGPVKLALRKHQLELSQTSSMMAIFLGKNILGQSDHPELPVDGNIIRESNEQMLALADLINRPSPVRTLESLERKKEAEE